MIIEVKVPSMGESITEVSIASWLKKDGERVDMDEIICELESEKASVEIAAEASGILKILKDEGETIEVGTIIAKIDQEDAEKKEKQSDSNENKTYSSTSTESNEANQAFKNEGSKPKITSVAANILDQAGIDAEQVTGHGADGRIRKEDALKAVQKKENESKKAEPNQQQSQPNEKTQSETTIDPSSDLSSNRKTRRERMTMLRKTISKKLLAAKHETAMLTTFNEVDMTELIAIRETYKERFKDKYGIKLGYMSLFTKACSITLLNMPIINAKIDGDDILYHEYTDIAIAVSTDRGLVVPVIRNAEQLSLGAIERTLAELAEKARANKLSMDELTGGTFSITNGGIFGSMLSTPLLNAPQSAILGMHAIQERPVVRDNTIVIRPMMFLALSYDHRLIDGKDSVSFLVKIKEILENPIQMILDV